MRNRHFLVPLLLTLALMVVGSLAQPHVQQAAAAACPGADKGPRQISSKTAARVVACLINEKRDKHGKGKLRFRSSLSQAARGHSKRMQKSNCFDHVCPGEAGLVQRYERADYLPCSCSWGAAENIAWGSGRMGTPRKIVKAWMHSPTHRANILGSYEHVGGRRSLGLAAAPRRQGRHLHARLRLQALSHGVRQDVGARWLTRAAVAQR